MSVESDLEILNLAVAEALTYCNGGTSAEPPVVTEFYSDVDNVRIWIGDRPLPRPNTDLDADDGASFVITSRELLAVLDRVAAAATRRVFASPRVTSRTSAAAVVDRHVADTQAAVAVAAGLTEAEREFLALRLNPRRSRMGHAAASMAESIRHKLLDPLPLQVPTPSAVPPVPADDKSSPGMFVDFVRYQLPHGHRTVHVAGPYSHLRLEACDNGRQVLIGDDLQGGEVSVAECVLERGVCGWIRKVGEDAGGRYLTVRLRESPGDLGFTRRQTLALLCVLEYVEEKFRDGAPQTILDRLTRFRNQHAPGQGNFTTAEFGDLRARVGAGFLATPTAAADVPPVAPQVVPAPAVAREFWVREVGREFLVDVDSHPSGIAVVDDPDGVVAYVPVDRIAMVMGALGALSVGDLTAREGEILHELESLVGCDELHADGLSAATGRRVCHALSYVAGLRHREPTDDVK